MYLNEIISNVVLVEQSHFSSFVFDKKYFKISFSFSLTKTTILVLVFPMYVISILCLRFSVTNFHFSFSFGLLLREGAGLHSMATADCCQTVGLSQTINSGDMKK